MLSGTLSTLLFRPCFGVSTHTLPRIFDTVIIHRKGRDGYTYTYSLWDISYRASQSLIPSFLGIAVVNPFKPITLPTSTDSSPMNFGTQAAKLFRGWVADYWPREVRASANLLGQSTSAAGEWNVTARMTLGSALHDNRSIQPSRAAISKQGAFEKTLQRDVLIVSLTLKTDLEGTQPKTMGGRMKPRTLVGSQSEKSGVETVAGLPGLTQPDGGLEQEALIC